MCKFSIAITLVLALFVCCTQARSALKDGKEVPCDPEGRHYSPWELMDKDYMENDEELEKCLRFQCLNGTIKVFKQYLSKACDRPRTPEEWQLWVEQGPQRGESVTMPPALVTTSTPTTTQGDQQTPTSLQPEATQLTSSRPTRVSTSSPSPSNKISNLATSNTTTTTTTTPVPTTETAEPTEDSTSQYEEDGDYSSGEEEESTTSSNEELEKYLEEAINDGKTTSDNELGPKKFKGKDLNPLPKWRSNLDAPDDIDNQEFFDPKGQQVSRSGTTSTRRPISRLGDGPNLHFGRPSSTRRPSKTHINATPEPEEVKGENECEDEQELAARVTPLPDSKRPVRFRKLNKEGEHEMTKIHTTSTITPIISNHLDYQPSIAASTQQGEEPSPIFLHGESTWDRAFHVFLLFFYVCCLVVILGAVIIILKTLLGAFDIVVKTKAAKQAATLPNAPASRQMRTMFDLDV